MSERAHIHSLKLHGRHQWNTSTHRYHRIENIFFDFCTRYNLCRSRSIAKWYVRENGLQEANEHTHTHNTKRSISDGTYVWLLFCTVEMCSIIPLFVFLFAFCYHTYTLYVCMYFSSFVFVCCCELLARLHFIFWSENVAISKFFQSMHTLFALVQTTWKENGTKGKQLEKGS